MEEGEARVIIASPNTITQGENRVISVSNSGYTISHRATSEVRIDPEKRPIFSNISDDYHLLENLIRYARFCEQYNVDVPQMAQSLARAIGIQNGGKYNVLIYDYLLAIPEYPPVLNGENKALLGEGRWCNIVCYKSRLFGVCMFPTTDNVTFYFPEFSSFTPQVQQLIFSFGNKELRLCPVRQALAFDFKAVPIQQGPAPATTQAILLTATLKRKLSAMSPPMVSKKASENVPDVVTDGSQEQKSKRDFIQLD